jgi:phosphatidylinositol glycan class V
MIVSGFWALKYKSDEARGSLQQQEESRKPGVEQAGHEAFPLVRNLAVSQLVLALLTLTTAHVQIITRMSSAYPVWLWYLAARSRGGSRAFFQCFVRFMVVYAMVQGGLFASFLPPA